MSKLFRAGALVFAKDLELVATFYREVLEMQVRHQDADHQVLESADARLIVHAIPAHIAATFAIRVPPELREEQAIKLFFTVASLEQSAAIAKKCGGGFCGPAYEYAEMRSQNAFDPEGNILSLNEHKAV